MNLIRHHPFLALILLLFLLLASSYSVVTPIFEAGDGIWHYPYVQHLATGHLLPVQDPAVKTLWAQEGGQPPVYYALAALATFWIDTRDLSDLLWYNPHAKIGIPLLFGNKNMIVHTSAEAFPWHNTALAVHIIRLLSILFSTATVLLTFLLAQEMGADQIVASAAAAFVAFNPMFIFISASVNNDSLAAMLAALALLLLTQLLKRGTSMSQFALLGIVLGLAAITKVSDFGLVVVAAVVFGVLFVRAQSRGAISESQARGSPWAFPLRGAAKQLVWGALLSAGLVILVAGWWYLRNYLLYGDPTAFNVWVAVAGGRPSPASLATLLGEFQGLRISFWGNFGGVNIIAPEWVYSILDLVTLLALFGLLIGIIRRTLQGILVLAVFWFVLIFAALIRWTMLTLASQGRLLFPAISAFAVLLACGLAQLLMPRRELPPQLVNSRIAQIGLFIPIIFLFGFSAFAPITLIRPTYALPKRLAANATAPNPTGIIFDEQAELVGYSLPQKSVQPGSELPITLYWRAYKPMVENYSIYIHLFDSNGNPVGQWDAYPGNGSYPTRLWQSQVIVDEYRVPVSVDARGPEVGRVEVGLYRKETLKNLIARDPQGRVITPSIARFKIAGQANVQVENPVHYEFGSQVALVGSAIPNQARAGEVLKVKLYWRALTAVEEDYTVFVHILDGSGRLIAQKDDEPRHGTYPSSFWDAGEIVADDYLIEIPQDASEGDYRIEIGLYRAIDNSRLVVNGSDHLDLASLPVVR